MIKLYQKSSIKYKIILSILVFVLIPVIILLVFAFSYFQRMLATKINDSLAQSMTRSNNSLGVFIDNIINVTYVIHSDEQIIEILRHPLTVAKDVQRYYANSVICSGKITNLSQTLLSQLSTAKVTVYDMLGTAYTAWPRTGLMNDRTDEFVEGGHLQRVQARPGYFFWLTLDDNNGSPILLLARSVENPVSGGMIGVITVAVSAEELYRVALGSGDGMGPELFIVDAANRIISGDSSRQELIDSYMTQAALTGDPSRVLPADDARAILSHAPIQYTDWQLVSLSDYNDVFRDLSRLQLISAVTLTVFLGMFLAAILSILRGIVNPILRLTDAMNNMREGHMRAIPDTGQGDEIAQLIVGYNGMARRNRELIEDIRVKESEQRVLQLELLQAQFNPHFLFNTLNTVKWMAIISQNNAIAQMVERLGRLLEMGVRYSESLIPLREELLNLESYLSIQRVRYHQSIELTIPGLDPLAEEVPVPVLILQPLVENSLTHGYKDPQGNAPLEIEAFFDGEDLLIAVTDYGLGVAPGRLDELRESLRAGRNRSREGRIGLHHVHRRLRLLFGREYGIDSIVSVEGQGTTVTVRLSGGGRGGKRT